MSKTLRIRAPKSMKLHAMSEREVEKYIAEEAGRMLDAMPRDIRPVGVNKVAIDSLVKGTAADAGVWAQWTRACCDKRDRIDDFVDPVMQEFDQEASLTRPELANEHVESQMRVQTLAYPAMHGKAKTPRKKR